MRSDFSTKLAQYNSIQKEEREREREEMVKKRSR